MKKEQLKQILEFAKFSLLDNQYYELVSLLQGNHLKRARLFLEELIEEKEINLIICDYDTIDEYDLNNLNKIQDLIIDLIVNEIDNVEERKQFRKIIE